MCNALALEPPESWHDLIFVYAATARRAKVLALRAFRRRFTGAQRRDRLYLSDSRANPFAGMLAVPVERDPDGYWSAPTPALPPCSCRAQDCRECNPEAAIA